MNVVENAVGSAEALTNPIAIIGMGCLFPKADSLATYWANICNRVDAIGPVPPTHWRPEDYLDANPKAPDRVYAARGGFLAPVAFPPLDFGISPNTLEATDTTQLLGLMVARQALDDAGYGAGRAFDRNRVSVILGVTGTLELVIPLGARLGHPIWKRALKEAGVADDVAADVVERIAASYVGWQEDSFPGLLGNVAAGRIANRLDLGGTNCVVDAACASSLGAIHLAMLELSTGRSDMVLSGGLDTFNDIFMFMCFSKTPALSPTGNAKPFDSKGDGTILGEGLGIVVLKRHADAVRDNDRIYAVIRGVGTSSDGKGNAIYAPSPAGQAKALRQAYRVSGVTPETIELVEAHGTGTRAGDAAEVTALTDVYGSSDSGAWCALGSVKSQIGHTKAAAGVAGLIKAALALHHKVLPPTIKVEQPIETVAPGHSAFYVNTEQRPWMPTAAHPRRAAVSSFGFGGSNFHLVLEEPTASKPGIAWDGDVQIVAFSAATPAELVTAVKSWPAELPWEELRGAAARSRQAFSGAHRCRLLVALEKGNISPSRILAGVQARLSQGGSSPWNTPDGAYYAENAPTGKLGLLFPGQGSQAVGMLRDLACKFPQMHEALAFAESMHGKRTSDFIYPQPEFSAANRARNEEILRATDIAQPALGAVNWGALQILRFFGIQAEALAGHSFGELVALCAGGAIDERALVALARLRGRLMAESKGGDRGAMLAVRAPRATVETLLREEALDLVIANKNAHNQFVLSGASAAIAQASAACARREIAAIALPVAAAFHSHFVADAQAAFRKVLADIEFTACSIPVFANSTGEQYPNDHEAMRDLLAGQLAKPVEFIEEIEAMVCFGVGTFVEVGPSNKLRGLVSSILEGKPHVVCSLDASSGKRSGMFDLACLLAQLAALGHHVNLPLWDDGSKRLDSLTSKKPTMTVALCGANYVKAKPAAQGKVTQQSTTPPAAKPIAPAIMNITSSPLAEASARQAATPKVERSPVEVRPLRSHNATSSQRPEALQDSKPMPQPDRIVRTNGSMAGVATTESPFLAQALRSSQENLLALQKLGEQTAQLHRQFLEGQDKVLGAFQTLLEQQNTLLQFPAANPIGAAESAFSPSTLPAKTAVSHTILEETVVRPAPPSPTRTVVAPVAPVAAVTAPSRTEALLLSVVSEKTGYPPEMLELDMELDADLGIDSIKRVEIFSSLQEKLPEAPAVKPEHLGTLRTLRHVVEFLNAGVPPTPSAALSQVAASATTEILLSVVSEKTGYPPEMLELDMELDADLGIDSIKRVEIFSSLQEKLPEAPAVKPEHLGTLRTLRHVVEFLSAGSPAPSDQQEQSEQKRAAPLELSGTTAALLLGVVSEKTGYPPEMLELDMELDADLGIDSIKRVEIFSRLQELLPDAPAVKPEHLGTLRTLRQVVEFLSGSPAPKSPAIAAATSPTIPMLSSRNGASEVKPALLHRYVLAKAEMDENISRPALQLDETSEIWITQDDSGLASSLSGRLNALGYRPRLISLAEGRTLEKPARLAGLIVVAPLGPFAENHCLQAFELLRLAAAGLRRSGLEGGGSLFATVSRLDGTFGLDDLAGDPTSGGLAGMAKTAAHEWPEVHCRALDVARSFDDSDDAALVLVEEILRVGPVEIGISQKCRCSLRQTEVAQAAPTRNPPLARGDVVVISGGARGVTAAAAVALARAFAPTLVLLGRSPEPTPEPDWLKSTSEPNEIKRALLNQAGGRATPKEIEESFRSATASREIRSTLEQIATTGATAVYRSVDVRDSKAVRIALDEIRSRFGPIRGLVHGAGVLADRLIEDKTPEQFSRVLATKVTGLRVLLEVVAEDDLKVLALFSSSTARFGRIGQVDYAVANEILNKIARFQAKQRPGCRVVAVNWGPWDGGMVTPALKKIFEKEGVGVIPLEAGADFLVRELSSNAGDVEVVVLADVEVNEGDLPSSVPTRAAVMPLRRDPENTFTLAFEREIRIDRLPILQSHVIDGQAVLPMALSLELLAHGALHGNPGMAFYGCDDLRILKGIRLEEGQVRAIRVVAGKATKQGAFHHVPVEMNGTGSNGRETPHAQARIILADKFSPIEAGSAPILPHLPPYRPSKAEIYDNLLFHGPDLQGIRQVEGCSAAGIVATVSTAPAPSAWLNQPLRNAWLADPLVLDCAFQLMILWSFETHGAGSLPCFAGSYRQYRRTFPRGEIRVVATIKHAGDQKAAADIDFLDLAGERIARLENYECIIDASLNQAFRNNRLGLLPVS